MIFGDQVRVLQVPPALPKGGLAKSTQSLFELCVGRVFPIVGFNDVGWLELEVGEVWGKSPCMESVWIEPELVEVVLQKVEVVLQKVFIIKTADGYGYTVAVDTNYTYNSEAAARAFAKEKWGDENPTMAALFRAKPQ